MNVLLFLEFWDCIGSICLINSGTKGKPIVYENAWSAIQTIWRRFPLQKSLENTWRINPWLIHSFCFDPLDWVYTCLKCLCERIKHLLYVTGTLLLSSLSFRGQIQQIAFKLIYFQRVFIWGQLLWPECLISSLAGVNTVSALSVRCVFVALCWWDMSLEPAHERSSCCCDQSLMIQLAVTLFVSLLAFIFYSLSSFLSRSGTAQNNTTEDSEGVCGVGGWVWVVSPCVLALPLISCRCNFPCGPSSSGNIHTCIMPLSKFLPFIHISPYLHLSTEHCQTTACLIY